MAASWGEEERLRQRIGLLERNRDFYRAAQLCFQLFEESGDREVGMRGFRDLTAGAWRSRSLEEMDGRLMELVERCKRAEESSWFTEEDKRLLKGVALEAEGWMTDPPNPSKMAEAVRIFVETGEVVHGLELVRSLVAFVEPEEQVRWVQYGMELTKKLPKDEGNTQYILLAPLLITYLERKHKERLGREVFRLAEELFSHGGRGPMENLAVLMAVNLTYTLGVERERGHQIRRACVDDLVRELERIDHNLRRGMALDVLGRSYYLIALAEKEPELRSDLFKRARDYYLESVSVLERTRAYGELFLAQIHAGTTFLSIAELEQDVEKRSTFYRLGREYLERARSMGGKTHLHQSRAVAAINLGVALERMSWFEWDLDRRKQILLETYRLQREGMEFSQRTKDYRAAGYASMNASEMCGFLSDMETAPAKKRGWALKQRELSLKGVEMLEQSRDQRGLMVALSYAAFACHKLSQLAPTLGERKKLLLEMQNYAFRAVDLRDEVTDYLARAYALQRLGDAYRDLGILEGDPNILSRAASNYEEAAKEWGNTGELHRRAEALTQLADVLLLQGLLTLGSSGSSPEDSKQGRQLLLRSLKAHQEAAEQFINLFLFHDAGENHWRMAQIHLVLGEYVEAGEAFRLVEEDFERAARLVPRTSEAYTVFRSLASTYRQLTEGLAAASRREYPQAASIFERLAQSLEGKTERSLRLLRLLLESMSAACRYASTGIKSEEERAKTQLERMRQLVGPNPFLGRLPLGAHAAIRRILAFLANPAGPFPAVLVELPLQEKMLAMAQTGHLVRTAMRLYQATAKLRKEEHVAPTEEILRSYLERVSSILAARPSGSS